MTEPITIEYEGRKYTWTGKMWYETETYIEPSQIIIRELNHLLTQALEREDAALTGIKTLLRRAHHAREAGQHGRAEGLARRALQLQPKNPAALAVLSAALRAQGRPRDALKETEPYRGFNHPPLLTSRAAALCDLRRWEQAKREVGRALAILGDKGKEEAFGVVRRIKAVRPDLYK